MDKLKAVWEFGVSRVEMHPGFALGVILALAVMAVVF